MSVQPAAGLPMFSSRVTRCQRIIAVAASAALMCSGVTSCTKTQVGLSVAAMAATVVGVTVGVTLAVQHSHHTLQGCIFSDANGLELRLSDAKVYALKGELADVKVGDRLNVHGSRVKKVKGDAATDHVFVVEKVNRDYGPCPANLGNAAAPTH